MAARFPSSNRQRTERRTEKPRRERRAPVPLDAAKLQELALAYVARFATSAAKCEDYLRRKLRERGWAGESAPDTRAIAQRLVEAGYIDDEAYARAKSGTLLRRGYGEQRVGQALNAAGIAAETRAAVRAAPPVTRAAALHMAQKRRIGPFGAALPNRALRQKQVAILMRAGHPLDSARELVNSPTIAAAEEWAAAVGEDE